jgi:hypothetical protein
MATAHPSLSLSDKSNVCVVVLCRTCSTTSIQSAFVPSASFAPFGPCVRLSRWKVPFPLFAFNFLPLFAFLKPVSFGMPRPSPLPPSLSLSVYDHRKAPFSHSVSRMRRPPSYRGVVLQSHSSPAQRSPPVSVSFSHIWDHRSAFAHHFLCDRTSSLSP